LRERIEELVKSIFGLLLAISMVSGLAVFFMILMAFVIGGDQGASIATFAWKQVVPTSIQIATAGVIVGFVIFYIKGEHTLRI
jgi:hypothetical protein